MKIISVLKSSITSLYLSLKRFPIAITLATLATILLIILAHNEQSLSSNIRDIIGRIAMILALGIPISLCTKLILERKEIISLIIKTSIYVTEALALVLFYFFLLKDFEMVPITRYVGFSISLYLTFIFMPYFYRRSGFELYVIKLLTRFFVTIIYSVVLFLGIAAILFTVDKLLGVNVVDKIYIDVWISIIGIFAPCFFLAGIPLYEDQFDITSYPKLLNVLLLYIVMPITAVYTAILYIYFAKITVTFQWPAGMVAHLVLWYSVVCAVILFLTSPLVDKSAWVKTFAFLLPKLILPLMIMMFISIGIRVNAYGVTENRYFVIVLGLWAFGIMLYLNLAKAKRNIVMAISLSLITVLSVVGPWSSYSISKFSQNKRFESILSKYGMIKDNTIVKSEKTITDTDKREISQILSYFSHNHKLTDVNYLPKEFKMEQMEKVFGFPNSEYYYRDQDKAYFSYASDTTSKPIDIKGYNYMLSIRSYESYTIKVSDNLEVRYDNKNHEIKINSSGKEIYKNSIVDFAKQIYKERGIDNKSSIDPNEMSLTDENESIRVKIIFQNINGYKVEASDEVNVEFVDFYILISQK